MEAGESVEAEAKNLDCDRNSDTVGTQMWAVYEDGDTENLCIRYTPCTSIMPTPKRIPYAHTTDYYSTRRVTALWALLLKNRGSIYVPPVSRYVCFLYSRLEGRRSISLF